MFIRAILADSAPLSQGTVPSLWCLISATCNRSCQSSVASYTMCLCCLWLATGIVHCVTLDSGTDGGRCARYCYVWNQGTERRTPPPRQIVSLLRLRLSVFLGLLYKEPRYMVLWPAALLYTKLGKESLVELLEYFYASR